MAQFYDTLIAEYLKSPGQRGLSLDRLAERDFEYRMISYDEVTNKGKMPFQEVELLEAAKYSGEDVYITRKLFEGQNSDSSPHLNLLPTGEGTKGNENNNLDTSSPNGRGLRGGQGSLDVFSDIEMPLLEVLIQMQLDGVKIDRDRLKGIGTQLENEIASLEKEIYHDADMEFNIKSPKQVGEVLFENLGLPTGKKTKTGYSVSAEVLGDLARDYPIAQKIVNYRHYSKLLSTYVEGLLGIINSTHISDDIVHTSYNQTVTTTGRLSSTDPNLQNIPTGDGLAGEIRDAFISRFEGGKIMACDYSQVEVRLLAIMSGEENLIRSFNEGLDIHHTTGEFLFGPPSDSPLHKEGEKKVTITPSQRKIAKMVNFGVIYGVSAFGLSKMIGLPQGQSKTYIDTFYANYPKVRQFFDQVIADCEKKGYVETMFGRRRYISEINDKNKTIKNGAEREAINMPIQGTSADIIKLAMIRVAEFLKSPPPIPLLSKEGEAHQGGGGLKSKMIMQVHDELVFDVYPGEEEVLAKNVQEIMQSILPDAPVDLKVDVGIGRTWKEAK